MKKKRLPLQALQKAVRDLLTACQTTPLHEHVGETAKLPLIAFGEISVSLADAKDTSLYTAALELEIYSSANSRTEINGILDDVATVLTAARLDMQAAGFAVCDQEITEVQTSPRENKGYSATLHMEVVIQDLEG